MSRSTIRRAGGGWILLALLLLLAASPARAAAGGLQNPSFEDGLNGWAAHTVTTGPYYDDTIVTDPDCSTAEKARHSVCVIGTDGFTADGKAYTVAPLSGDHMARLGGPYTSGSDTQPLERHQLAQTFTVDAADPILRLGYDVFAYDTAGYDQLRFTVQVQDASGDEIASVEHSAPGTGAGLKTSGWQTSVIDLTGYEGRQLHLVIDAGGTHDQLHPFWAYVDAGTAPAPTVRAPVVTGTGGAAPQVFTDALSGEHWYVLPASYGTGCNPLAVAVPIEGAVSAVSVLLGSTSVPLSDGDLDGTWTGTIPCAADGRLSIQYTRDGTTFVVGLGGITLVDPSGVVYDRKAFDAAKAGGATDDAARASAAIAGATVRLQRKLGGEWSNVLAGDASISPGINPEVTGADGRYAWDVAPGDWRVVVAKAGYTTATSREVSVPPAVTDLHVALEPVDAGPGPGDGGGGGGGDTPPPPATAATATPSGTSPSVAVPAGVLRGCARYTGAKRSACKRHKAAAARLAECRAVPRRGGRRSLCLEQARAINACEAKPGRLARRTCLGRYWHAMRKQQSAGTRRPARKP